MMMIGTMKLELNLAVSTFVVVGDIHQPYHLFQSVPHIYCILSFRDGTTSLFLFQMTNQFLQIIVPFLSKIFRSCHDNSWEGQLPQMMIWFPMHEDLRRKAHTYNEFYRLCVPSRIRDIIEISFCSANSDSKSFLICAARLIKRLSHFRF